MDEREVAMFVRSISGSTFKVLFMMLFMQRSTGPAELATLTGLSAWTCERSLQELEYLQAAQRHTRVNGWMLTAKARQLVMEMQGAALPATEHSEHRNSMLGSSSSCYLSCSETDPLPEPETTPERGKSTLASGSAARLADELDPDDADAEEAVAQLMATGCPERTRTGNGARDVVEAALSRWTGEEVLDAVEGWIAYTQTPAGKWVTHPGFFAGSRVKRGQHPPEMQTQGSHDIRQYLPRSNGGGYVSGGERWQKRT